MTPQQLEQIADMRERRGWSYKRIANALGMSPGAVSWYCLKEAIEAPNPRKPVTEIKGPLEFRRGNHIVRRFTPEEDGVILAMEMAGASRAAIARRLGRKSNSVLGRSMCLARRLERGGTPSEPPVRITSKTSESQCGDSNA